MIPFSYYIDKFLNYISIERNYSPHTLLNYKIDLKEFGDFLSSREKKDIKDIDYFLLRKFLSVLAQKNLSKRSTSRKISTLKSFFKFLVREGITKNNPAVSLIYPRLEKTLPKFLTEDEVKRILAMPEGGDVFSLRDKAILEFLYSTGARVCELVSLKKDDLDLIVGIAKVKGKARKERLLPVGEPALMVLKKYLDERTDTNPSLFVNRRGGTLTDRGVRNIINGYVKKVAISLK
ncbi:MAG: site-specific integrase, partial [Candidatus Omnitrophota bacterium]